MPDDVEPQRLLQDYDLERVLIAAKRAREKTVQDTHNTEVLALWNKLRGVLGAEISYSLHFQKGYDSEGDFPFVKFQVALTRPNDKAEGIIWKRTGEEEIHFSLELSENHVYYQVMADSLALSSFNKEQFIDWLSKIFDYYPAQPRDKKEDQ